MSSLNVASERAYLRSHPWLTFRADFRRASPELWMLLGECASKCEHIAGVPLRPDIAREMYRVYLAKGALATTAIEGNTLTEQEVRQRIDGSLQVSKSREYMVKEVDNILDACNGMLLVLESNGSFVISAERLKQLNGAALNGLALEDGVTAGEVRRYSVTVGRYVGAPAQDCWFLLERLCEWLNGDEFQPSSGMEIHYAILKAILAHLYFAWIHPFGDGNGRTARLLEFQILIASGVPAPAAHLLSNHYNQTRSEYYRQLELASKSGGDFLPFALYALQGFADGLRQQVAWIRALQFDVTWRNFVHEKFTGHSATDKRRRDLVLDLSSSENAIPAAKIPELSARMGAAYSNLNRSTIQRDLNYLQQQQLIVRRPDGYIANKELIEAFLPQRAQI